MKTVTCLNCFLILLIANSHLGKASDCVPRDFGYGSIVCVCDADSCDTLPSIKKLNSPYYQVFTSTKSGLRFKRTEGSFSFNVGVSKFISKKARVIKDTSYQKIIGFGGSFTDSFGINLGTLSENLQTELLRSYFSEDGLEYSIGRVPIGGTDFSDRGYSYCDTETEDRNLSKFNLTDDDFQNKIPYILQANSLSSNSLLLFAAAWIAPKWMKTNGEYSGFGNIKPDMYDVWANYFIKFLDAYKKQNITFWGISTGNEPSLALVGNAIPSNRWIPDDMIKWVGSNLGPTIRKSDYKDLKIMLLDDQRLFVPWFIDSVFTDINVKNYVDVIAVHWYLDWLVPATVLDDLHNKYPEIPIMGTEASIDSITRGSTDAPVALGFWERGENYALNIIENLNHHFTSWTDWNMALNPSGGPTYIGNYVDSPIIINGTANEFYKQPMFYAIGHFSKFIPRDSVRIKLEKTESDSVTLTGFLRPDGGTVIVFVNKDDSDQKFHVRDIKRGNLILNLEAHSISTIIYY